MQYQQVLLRPKPQPQAPPPAPPKLVPQRSSGTQAVVGAVLAVVGVLAAANPSNLILQAISNAAPQLAHAVPTVITACGAIIAAFSAPPRLSRASR